MRSSPSRSGEAEIEYHTIVGNGFGCSAPIFSGCKGVDPEALFRKTLDDRSSETVMIFDQEDAHVAMVVQSDGG